MKKELADFFAPVQELGKYKGTLYGLNYFIDMGVTQYRKDLLAQEGLPSDRKSLPKTWDQFREWGRKLAKLGGGHDDPHRVQHAPGTTSCSSRR